MGPTHRIHRSGTLLSRLVLGSKERAKEAVVLLPDVYVKVLVVVDLAWCELGLRVDGWLRLVSAHALLHYCHRFVAVQEVRMCRVDVTRLHAETRVRTNRMLAAVRNNLRDEISHELGSRVHGGLEEVDDDRVETLS